MDESWCIHTVEYYTAIGMNKLQIHTWMNLKNNIEQKKSDAVHAV